ncbi:hypothetical protein GGF32_005178 [Allomyces javanicus]|nr:hypothetical protein GGF32_005178 [Allomyces javanicus]
MTNIGMIPLGTTTVQETIPAGMMAVQETCTATTNIETIPSGSTSTVPCDMVTPTLPATMVTVPDQPKKTITSSMVSATQGNPKTMPQLTSTLDIEPTPQPKGPKSITTSDVVFMTMMTRAVPITSTQDPKKLVRVSTPIASVTQDLKKSVPVSIPTASATQDLKKSIPMSAPTSMTMRISAGYGQPVVVITKPMALMLAPMPPRGDAKALPKKSVPVQPPVHTVYVMVPANKPQQLHAPVQPTVVYSGKTAPIPAQPVYGGKPAPAPTKPVYGGQPARKIAYVTRVQPAPKPVKTIYVTCVQPAPKPVKTIYVTRVSKPAVVVKKPAPTVHKKVVIAKKPVKKVVKKVIVHKKPVHKKVVVKRVHHTKPYVHHEVEKPAPPPQQQQQPQQPAPRHYKRAVEMSAKQAIAAAQPAAAMGLMSLGSLLFVAIGMIMAAVMRARRRVGGAVQQEVQVLGC